MCPPAPHSLRTEWLLSKKVLVKQQSLESAVNQIYCAVSPHQMKTVFYFIPLNFIIVLHGFLKPQTIKYQERQDKHSLLSSLSKIFQFFSWSLFLLCMSFTYSTTDWVKSLLFLLVFFFFFYQASLKVDLSLLCVLCCSQSLMMVFELRAHQSIDHAECKRERDNMKVSFLSLQSTLIFITLYPPFLKSDSNGLSLLLLLWLSVLPFSIAIEL